MSAVACGTCLHPSVQVGRYQMYLQDTHTAFYEDDAVSLSACSYLHNYPFFSADAIFAPKFLHALQTWPLFTKDDVDKLEEYLIPRVSEPGGLDILRRVEESEYRPSKKLMNHVAEVIDGKPEYVLLDEQLVVYDKVLAAANRSSEAPHVVLVKGGPGTGKSVIAINLMADLLRDGKNAQYATGSKAFTETLRTAIGSRGSVQFTYFNSYMNADRDTVDVLICDEAHRIRQHSHNRFTKKQDRTNKLQVDELLDVSRVSVFFIDDDQVVRPGEIGSVDLIKERAKRKGLQLDEFELEAQFRCAGSDAFVNWINNTLNIRRTANAIWEGAEGFDFRIFEDPFSLEQAIREKNAEGHTARVTAGFCWPWSKTPLPDGTLELDVQIGDYERPWNARHDASRLAPGIPKAHLWAYDPDGIDQVGCVYTAQGFEFDYVGVIFGLDLRYDLDRQEWIGDKSQSHDGVVKRSKDQFTQLVKNTYRVLLSRGMKGCYVCFLDKDTERFFRSRMASGQEKSKAKQD